jgi:hypothetical protein
MGLFSKIFTVNGNRVPEELRTQLEAEGVIVLSGKVSVSQGFSGHVPGLFSSTSRNRSSGTLAITRQRVYASLPYAPRLKQPAIDQRWDAEQQGPAKVTIDGTGVHLDIDIKHVDPRFQGDLTLLYRQEFTEAQLAQLPARSLAFSVTPDYVFHILGVRAKT